jgi:hypothetical protein
MMSPRGLGHHHVAQSDGAVFPEPRPGARDERERAGAGSSISPRCRQHGLSRAVSPMEPPRAGSAIDPGHGRGLVARRHHGQCAGPGFFPTELTAAGFCRPTGATQCRADLHRPQRKWTISTARSCSCAPMRRPMSPARSSWSTGGSPRNESACLYRPETQAYREVADPARQTMRGECLAVEAVGICGSDMHAYLGHDERRPAPLILGHEVAGVVVSGPLRGKSG